VVSSRTILPPPIANVPLNLFNHKIFEQINYYIENGTPLEDYYSIITLLEELPKKEREILQQYTKHITTITEGFSKPTEPKNINYLTGKLREYSPGLISLNLGKAIEGIDNQEDDIDSLEDLEKLKYVYSSINIVPLVHEDYEGKFKLGKITVISTNINSWESWIENLDEEFIAQGMDLWRRRCDREEQKAPISLELEPPRILPE